MSDEKQDGGPCESHDVHLWPQTHRDFDAPSVHGVTEDAIGINVGGYVIVQPIRTWHAQAKSYAALEAELAAERAGAGSRAQLTALEALCAALLADVEQDEGYERLRARCRELEAENIDLRQLIAQWQKNCTGMNGSQLPCGMSADHTVETTVKHAAGCPCPTCISHGSTWSDSPQMNRSAKP